MTTADCDQQLPWQQLSPADVNKTEVHNLEQISDLSGSSSLTVMLTLTSSTELISIHCIINSNTLHNKCNFSDITSCKLAHRQEAHSHSQYISVSLCHQGSMCQPELTESSGTVESKPRQTICTAHQSKADWERRVGLPATLL